MNTTLLLAILMWPFLFSLPLQPVWGQALPGASSRLSAESGSSVKSFKSGQFQVGLSATGGFALTGADFEYHEEGTLIPSPTNMIWVPGGADVNLRYWLESTWGVSFGVGNLRATLKKRSPNFRRPVQPWEEPWGAASVDWRISVVPMSMGLICRSRLASGNTLVVGLNLEYYRASNHVSATFSRYNHQRNDFDEEPMTGVQKAGGMGFSGYLSHEAKMWDGLSFQAQVMLRIGDIKEVSREVSLPYIVWNPVSLSVTGVYAKLGLVQSF